MTWPRCTECYGRLILPGPYCQRCKKLIAYWTQSLTKLGVPLSLNGNSKDAIAILLKNLEAKYKR